MIWFTADYHLSHKNIIKYCNRPFSDVEDMDNTILENLKTCVKPNDTLYFLGDLSFNTEDVIMFFESLKDIKVHYITGNHDSNNIIKLAKQYCESVSQIKDIKIEEQSITLCHYSMRVWHKSHFNSWQLYGHSHAKLTPIGKQHDVGIDNNKFFPVSFDDLVKIMDNKPNNFNFLTFEKR